MAEFIGKIVGLSMDFETRKWQVTFSIDDPSALESLDKLKVCERLSVHAIRDSPKRSLNANAYLWVLCSKMASVLKTSKEEVYEEMLQSYGTFYHDDDGYITVTVKTNVDMTKVGGHWRHFNTTGDFSSYLMIKGSSQYTVSEMSALLDGTITEAKSLGIDTATDSEIERMLEQWGKQYQS